jgi:hypothetical protein
MEKRNQKNPEKEHENMIPSAGRPIQATEYFLLTLKRNAFLLATPMKLLS